MRWGCYSAQCYSRETRKPFEFEANVRKCPQCGATEQASVGARLVHHYMTADGHNGKINGVQSRYRIACNSELTMKRLADEYESATGEPHLVNCDECLQTAEYLAHLRMNAKHEDYLSMLSERHLALLGNT